MRAMEISRTGLDVEWRRLELVAQNIANANTTRTEGGQPYQAMRLLSGPKVGFSEMLRPDGRGLTGVAPLGVQSMSLPPRRVHEPSHPDADADGYVSYPGIDQVSEMTLMVKTARAYEANVVAMNAARQMYAKALEIGRRS